MMSHNCNKIAAQLPVNDFFGWKYHPFADTYKLGQQWLSTKDQRLLESIKRLLHTGKSIGLCGPSGAGKTFLIHSLIRELDKNSYRTVLVPYGGHLRNGLTRLLAESFGVETTGRGVPIITRIQQHLETMSSGSSPRHPVIIIDDAQLVETDSLWDLCSLLFQTTGPVAASLILAGDETLAKRLELYGLLPVRARLTTVMKLQPMNEYETREFIENRLKNGGAPPDLFEDHVIDLIAAHARGNRRTVMNLATMALEEAYYREEKTVTSEAIYNSDWFNESE